MPGPPDGLWPPKLGDPAEAANMACNCHMASPYCLASDLQAPRRQRRRRRRFVTCVATTFLRSERSLIRTFTVVVLLQRMAFLPALSRKSERINREFRKIGRATNGCRCRPDHHTYRPKHNLFTGVRQTATHRHDAPQDVSSARRFARVVQFFCLDTSGQPNCTGLPVTPAGLNGALQVEAPCMHTASSGSTDTPLEARVEYLHLRVASDRCATIGACRFSSKLKIRTVSQSSL